MRQVMGGLSQQLTPFTYVILLDLGGLPTDQKYVVAIGRKNRPFTLSPAYDETQYDPGECEIEFFSDVPVYDAVEGAQAKARIVKLEYS